MATEGCVERGTVWVEGEGPIRHGLVIGVRCGTYACETCGRRKVRRLRRRLAESLESHLEEAQRCLGGARWWVICKMLTLTCDPKRFADPFAAVHAMARGWNRLHTAIEKVFAPMRFFRVWELHRSGWPHLHIILLTPKFIPWEWLVRKWTEYGIGQSIRILNKSRRIASPRFIATYLTKYLAKNLGVMALPFVRRWGASRGFLLPEERVKWWSWRQYDSHTTVAENQGLVQSWGALIAGYSSGFSWAMPGAYCALPWSLGP